jgi:hypothetical protein
MEETENVKRWLRGDKTALKSGPQLHEIGAHKSHRDRGMIVTWAKYFYLGRMHRVEVQHQASEDWQQPLADALEQDFQQRYSLPF